MLTHISVGGKNLRLDIRLTLRIGSGEKPWQSLKLPPRFLYLDVRHLVRSFVGWLSSRTLW